MRHSAVAAAGGDRLTQPSDQGDRVAGQKAVTQFVDRKAGTVIAGQG